MRIRTLQVLVLVALSSLFFGGCAGPQTRPKADAVVYVAVPLSGFMANGGQTVLGGVRLAAEQVNRSGGLLGHHIDVRPLDDEADSEVAVSQVEQIQRALDSGEEVLAVIGHLNSGQTLAAMELYRELDLVVITPTSSEKSLSERGYDNFFRVNADDTVQAAVDARFLVEQLNAKRVAVIHNDTEYGRGLADLLIVELERMGGASVLTLEVTEGQSRYQTEVAQVLAADPEAVFYAGYEIEAPYLRTALVEAGLDAPMLASDGAFLGATIDEAGGSAEGMYVSAFAPSPENVTDERWREAYQAVEYRDPDTYSVNGYVALEVLAEGARKARSLDAGSIAESLRTHELPTLLDALRYHPNGNLVDAQIWIYQVREGQFRQIGQ
ncbi:MAG: branched-chain amino acid ABC transporter substrate-binding protein [Anaerolineae bacterium]|jgi:branched-chain amino acid transport system substrate-binding protein